MSSRRRNTNNVRRPLVGPRPRNAFCFFDCVAERDDGWLRLRVRAAFSIIIMPRMVVVVPVVPFASASSAAPSPATVAEEGRGGCTGACAAR